MLPAIHVDNLGIMLRVYRRHEFICKVFETLARLATEDRKVTVSVLYDRPTAKVLEEVNHGFDRFPWLNRIEIPAPFPLVDEKGEHFMEALDVQYEDMRAKVPNLDAASLWDDDMWFRPAGIFEATKLLDKFEADRIETRTYFLWDKMSQANDAFPAHWQALFFRVYPEDRYTTEFMVHCPEHTAFSPYLIRQKERLHNAGYMKTDERQKTWEQFQRAGKIDAHTMCLVNPPCLVNVGKEPHYEENNRVTRTRTAAAHSSES
jgi:hypothetical protein